MPQFHFQLFFYNLNPQLKLGEEKISKHRPQISQQQWLSQDEIFYASMKSNTQLGHHEHFVLHSISINSIGGPTLLEHPFLVMENSNLHLDP
jgi:hypothetical protein